MKKVILICLCVLSIFANEYNDDDLDGVPNSLDRCPNTPFSDIVDEYGCSIERLIKPKSYDIYFEYVYIRDNDIVDFKENDYIFSATLYRNNFDFSITTTYFDNSLKHGFSDTSIKIEYRFTPTPMWDLYVGTGVDLPTYNRKGNFLDYNLFIDNEYYYKGVKFFVGGYYTFTRDKYRSKRLQNPYGMYIGLESYYKRWSFDIALLHSKSKFQTHSNILYTKIEKSITKGYYIYATFSKGLTHKAIDTIVSIGFGRRY